VPGVPLLLAKPWHAPSVRKDLAKFAAMTDERAFVAAAQLAPPLPCAADHPLFVSYTSGSTGKPKGVVHGHGGYVAGVLASMVGRSPGLFSFCFCLLKREMNLVPSPQSSSYLYFDIDAHTLDESLLFQTLTKRNDKRNRFTLRAGRGVQHGAG
jgi:acyl-CoA synthetase (AMP-forming)/AMP-acid ligase II